VCFPATEVAGYSQLRLRRMVSGFGKLVISPGEKRLFFSGKLALNGSEAG